MRWFHLSKHQNQQSKSRQIKNPQSEIKNQTFPLAKSKIINHTSKIKISPKSKILNPKSKINIWFLLA